MAEVSRGRSLPICYDDGRSFRVFEDGRVEGDGMLLVTRDGGRMTVVDVERPEYAPLTIDWPYLAALEAAKTAEEREAIIREHHADSPFIAEMAGALSQFVGGLLGMHDAMKKMMEEKSEAPPEA